MIEKKCIRCADRIGVVVIITSSLLTVFKLFVGITSNSHALTANAFYSIQDVISAVVVWWGSKFSKKKGDERYPYGYGKFEFITAGAISVIIIIALVIIVFLAGTSVFMGPRSPGILALFGAIISLIITYFLANYTKCAGKTVNSPAIISSAHHIHSDVISSTCVTIGIFITMFGFRHLDPIIAIFEALHVMHETFGILRDAYKGLIDSPLSAEEEEGIREIIENVNGVKGTVFLKTRALGRENQIDCEIELAETETIASSEAIKKELRASIVKEMPHVSVVNIAVAPFRSRLQKEKQTSVKIARIISKYCRNFVQRHELKVSDNKIELSLFFLRDIPKATCQALGHAVRKQIKQENPETEIVVFANPEIMQNVEIN